MNEFNVSMCREYIIGCKHRTECLLQRKCLGYSYGGIISSKEEPLMPGEITYKEKEQEIYHFTSGASSSGHKPPYECLTLTLLTRAARRMEKGLHYGKHNWKKGATDKQFILDRLNHALEHLVKAMGEIDNDVPMDDDDLAGVVVNCMMAMEFQSTKSK